MTNKPKTFTEEQVEKIVGTSILEGELRAFRDLAVLLQDIEKNSKKIKKNQILPAIQGFLQAKLDSMKQRADVYSNSVVALDQNEE